ncbi:MAG: leucine-rich repeat domain-containing protein [Eubacterium sp.]
MKKKVYIYCLVIIVLIFCSSCAQKTDDKKEYQELKIIAEDFHRSNNILSKYVGDELVGHSKDYEGVYYDVILPDEYETIGTNALYGKHNVVSYYVPDSIEKIGDAAFAFSDNLKSIRLSDNLSYIGSEAFRSTALESIEIPDSVTQICDSAFERCKNLKEVKLSSNLEVLGSMTFSECVSLESIEIPYSVEKIYDTFSGCNKLSEVVINNPDTVINNYAFYGCSSDLTIYAQEGSSVQKYAEEQGYNFKEIE